VTSDHSIDLSNCATGTRIDAEINAAQDCGLKFWAYCWYGPHDPMQNAWRLHQASSIKERMNWSIIFASPEIFMREVTASGAAYISYLQQRNYQLTASGRPVVFMLGEKAGDVDTASAIRRFRSMCKDSGLLDPYFVSFQRSGSPVVTGADAIAVYACAPATNAGPYSTLAAAAAACWRTLDAQGRDIVPTAMTGWDRRPRIDRPVSWERSYQQPGAGRENYYTVGTPEQIAAHVRSMVEWMNTNRTRNRSRIGLIYSWDEHDEGGSTLSPTLGDSDTLLHAVGGVLKAARH
jgi:hypothetical protein